MIAPAIKAALPYEPHPARIIRLQYAVSAEDFRRMALLLAAARDQRESL